MRIGWFWALLCFADTRPLRRILRIALICLFLSRRTRASPVNMCRLTLDWRYNISRGEQSTEQFVNTSPVGLASNGRLQEASILDSLQRERQGHPIPLLFQSPFTYITKSANQSKYLPTQKHHKKKEKRKWATHHPQHPPSAP